MSQAFPPPAVMFSEIPDLFPSATGCCLSRFKRLTWRPHSFSSLGQGRLDRSRPYRVSWPCSFSCSRQKSFSFIFDGPAFFSPKSFRNLSVLPQVRTPFFLFPASLQLDDDLTGSTHHLLCVGPQGFLDVRPRPDNLARTDSMFLFLLAIKPTQHASWDWDAQSLALTPQRSRDPRDGPPF